MKSVAVIKNCADEGRHESERADTHFWSLKKRLGRHRGHHAEPQRR